MLDEFKERGESGIILAGWFCWWSKPKPPGFRTEWSLNPAWFHFLSSLWQAVLSCRLY